MNPKYRNLTGALAIIILGLAVYASGLNGEFIWDDVYLIQENPLVQSWAGLPKIFTSDIGTGAGHVFNFYRPLQMFTYMIDHALWNLDVRGYHFSSMMFHVLAALAVAGLIFVLYKDVFLSLVTGLLFVAHPVHTEAVSYISGRADSLAALFMLLTLILYVKTRDAQGVLPAAGCGLLYALALLSRENSLILPALILLYHYTFKQRIRLSRFAPLAVLAVGYVISRLTVFNFSLGRPPEPNGTFLQRLPGVFAALANYTRLLLFPFGLHMEYGKKFFPWLSINVAAGLILFLILLTVFIVKRKKRDLVFFGLMWFLVTLLPVSNLYPINSYMAEHWLYVPAIGFFLIMAGGLRCLYRDKNQKAFALGAAVVLVFFYSCLTVAQNGYWRDAVVFHERTLRYSPESQRMINGLAQAYYQQHRMADAVAVYEKALALYPREAFLYNNLGAFYLVSGQFRQAEPLFAHAVALDPDYGEAHANLAGIYFRLKQYDLAIEHCDKARARGVVNPRLLKALNPYRK